MRLLSFDEGGEVVWEEFNQDKIPPYAILSHTWGAEEVTFLDLIDKQAQGKAGYRKIQFCGEQAARDGLRHFWIDTCCIDKRNNTELTKAINSMFSWYRNAVKCYVYLSDVPASASDVEAGNAWEANFRKTRWHTRGWTLQELLAPASVIFYSMQHTRLGDKQSLARLIHEATTIPLSALQGSPLDGFSVDERMRWAAGRQTTEAEDGAYCLLGIFNIFMPLIYGEGKESALKRLRREIDGLPSKTTTAFTVPFERNSRFVGRESLLANVEELLFRGEQTTKVAIVGLGGIGKTQLAIELAYRTQAKHKNCSVFWMPAMTLSSLEQAYRDVARRLRVPGWDADQADVKKLVQEHLSQTDTPPWLLIFDNADDINMWTHAAVSEADRTAWSEYLPKSKQGCIVFTTRDRKTAVKVAGRDVVEISELEEDTASELLQKSLIDPSLADDLEQAKGLLEQLTCLPLAIVQAAAYINENSISLGDYLSLLNEQEEGVIELLSEDFQDEWRYPSIKNPVATTWLISFEKIRGRDSLAADYLSFMACIERKDIPQWLLPAGPSRKKELEAIGTLKAYSFITSHGEKALFDLHRLVYLATRNWLRKEGIFLQWVQTTVERLRSSFPPHREVHPMTGQWGVLLPHAACVLRQRSDKIHEVEWRELKLKYGRALQAEGRSREAEACFEELIATREKKANERDPDEEMQCCMIGLTNVYTGQCRYEAAEKLAVEIMELNQRKYGDECEQTLSARGQLWAIYGLQDRWKEAEELIVADVERVKKVFGEEHENVFAFLSGLALSYGNQNQFDKAEKLAKQALEGLRKFHGDDEHLSVLRGMYNLGSVYWKSGRMEETVKLRRQVVETSKRVLGENHPATVLASQSLAYSLKDRGRDEEAIELMSEFLQTGPRVLSPDDPHLDVSKQSLEEWRLERLKI